MIQSIGKKSLGAISYTLEVLLMVYMSFRATLRDQAQGLRTIFGVVSAQIYFTGWQAMPLISVLGFFLGGLVAVQFKAQVQFLGNAAYIGSMMIIIVIREIGPLATALLVIARSGTAVASEIGSMRVHKEIEALEAMGINPLSYIVFPRLVGGAVSVLCLGFYFNFVAVIGGLVVSHLLLDMPVSFYLESLAQAFELEDFLLFFLKNSFSGLIIFIVCCYQGLLVQTSPHEVPQMTTKGVMNSIIYVIVFNLLVSALFYLQLFIRVGLI